LQIDYSFADCMYTDCGGKLMSHIMNFAFGELFKNWI